MKLRTELQKKNGLSLLMAHRHGFRIMIFSTQAIFSPRVTDTMVKNSRKQPDSEAKIPEELSLSGIREKRIHPLNAPVWRSVLIISTGCASAWIFRTLLGFTHPLSIWLFALVTTASWVVAIMMLLSEARGKIFWIVWLSIGIVLLLSLWSEPHIWTASASFSFIFLLFRRYRPYRYLTSQRKAAFFLIGFIIFGLLTVGFLPRKIQEEPSIQSQTQPPQENAPAEEVEPKGGVQLARNLALYSLSSLRLFWFFSLFHLFFAIRLHFMRLRPKMAVSVFLIAGVPLLLVIIMGLLTLYGTLGESRAIRAGTLLQDWADLAVQDERFFRTISNRPLLYERKGEEIQTEGEPPSWLPDFLASLEKEHSRFQEWVEAKSGKYFWIGSEIWLMNLRNEGTSDIRIAACLLDEKMMNRLAKILHSDVKLSFSNPISFTVAGDITVRSVKSDEESKQAIFGRYIPGGKTQPAATPRPSSIWNRPLYFGMTHVDVISFQSGKFEELKILLLIESSLSDIARELLSERNPLSQVVMIVLLILAVLLLLLEAFALFFGVRITTGFTSAVRALHRGTRRIAAGDLDTRIDIPNEDELGDLAASLNEMAAAVKKGREEALARERLESELATARKIQERLLPHEMPEFSGFEIAGTSLPSQQVGGDYFDFLDIGTGMLGIAIADVSGKGIPAALLMANLQASLHAQAIESGNVAELVSRMNGLLVRSTDANMFATFFYGILDRAKSTFTSTNAGHNPPLVFRADGNIERLEAGGLIIGFLPDQDYKQESIKIGLSDILILYTDGITEAVGPSGGKISENLFGEDRLVEVMKASLEKSAKEIQSAILKAISDHTAGVPQSDDITLIVIKRTK